MRECTIRPAGPEDRAALTGFMAALQEHERAMETNRRPGSEMAETHLAHLLAWAAARPGGSALIAERAAPLGFCISGVEEEFGDYVLPGNRVHGVISDLYVVPEARGRGVGRALIAEAERIMRAAGLDRVHIATLSANEAAASAYRALGYAPHVTVLAKAL